MSCTVVFFADTRPVENGQIRNEFVNSVSQQSESEGY